jgi:hypothetical protein
MPARWREALRREEADMAGGRYLERVNIAIALERSIK